MKTGLFQYTLGRFLLTSVSVAKNATGLHFNSSVLTQFTGLSGIISMNIMGRLLY